MPAITKLILALIACFLLGLGVGYFSLPQKVVTQVEVKEKIVTVTEKVKADNVVTVYREIQRPDGTKEIRSRTFDKSVSTEAETKDDSKSVSETKTVERKQPDWKVAGLATTTGYGASIERRILGPIFLGAFGLSSGMAGISVGLLF
jgi:hypothetical protein